MDDVHDMNVRNKLIPKADESLEHWLTMEEAASLLAVDRTFFTHAERRGHVHPRYDTRSDTRGHMRAFKVYDPRELANTPVKHRHRHRAFANAPGELAAAAFEMFDEGRSLRSAVIELRQTPATVEQLYQQWCELERIAGNEWTISKGARAELERFVGTFENVAELVHRVIETCGITIQANVPPGVSDAEIDIAINRAIDAHASAP